MNMKLAPQIRATSTSWTGQRTRRCGPRPARALEEHGHVLAVGGDAGDLELLGADHEVEVDLGRVDRRGRRSSPITNGKPWPNAMWLAAFSSSSVS